MARTSASTRPGVDSAQRTSEFFSRITGEGFRDWLTEAPYLSFEEPLPFIRLHDKPEVSSQYWDELIETPSFSSVLKVIEQFTDDKIARRQSASHIWPQFPKEYVAECFSELIPHNIFGMLCNGTPAPFEAIAAMIPTKQMICLVALLSPLFDRMNEARYSPMYYLDFLSFHLWPQGDAVAMDMPPSAIRLVTMGYKLKRLGFSRQKLYVILRNNLNFTVLDSRSMDVIADFLFKSLKVEPEKLTVHVMGPSTVFTFKVENISVLQAWSNATGYFDISRSIYGLGSLSPPPTFNKLLYDAIVEDNLLLLRAFFQSNVLRINDSPPLLEAFFNVFSHHKSLDRMILHFLFAEVRDTPTPIDLFRSNTYTTKLLKLFTSKFGFEFLNETLKLFISRVLSETDLNIKNPDKCDGKKVVEFVREFIAVLRDKIDLVPNQLREACCFIKWAVVSKFNTIEAVLQGVCRFFILRYLLSALSAPNSYGIAIELSKDAEDTLLPLAQLIQSLFNMREINVNQFPHFAQYNSHFKLLMPQAAEFLYMLTDYNPNNEHHVPIDENTLQSSLERISAVIKQNYDGFTTNYSKLAEDSRNASYPSSWLLMRALLTCFTPTIP